MKSPEMLCVTFMGAGVRNGITRYRKLPSQLCEHLSDLY